MPRETEGRRQFLRSTTAMVVASVALAGCGDGGGDADGEDGGDGVADGGDTPGADGTPGGDGTPDGGETPGGDTPGGGMESFGGWLENTDNYDGVVDETGSSEVSVAVGAEGNDGNFAFEPAAVQVDTGTTVVWEWTGEGGMHNVVHDEGEFGSELAEEEGTTFEYTFEEGGTYRYECEPHTDLGMRGVVVAGEGG